MPARRVHTFSFYLFPFDFSLATKAERLKRARACAFKEPASADAQAVMPCRKPLRVECEPRLSCECAAESFIASQHGCALCSKTNGLAKLLKMFCAKRLAGKKRSNVVGHDASLLKSKLCCSRQTRRYVRVKRNVAEREDVLKIRCLQSGFDYD